MTPSTIGAHVATGSRNGYGKIAPYLRGVISFEYGAFDEVFPNCFKGWRDIKQWAYDPTNPTSGTDSDIPPGFDNFTPDMARANARVQWPRFLARHLAQPSDVVQLTNEYGGSDPAHLKALVAFEDELMLLNEAAGHPLTMGVCSCAGDSPGWDTYTWQSILAPHIWKAWGLGHIYIRHAYTGVNPGSPNMMINEAGVPADNNVARPFKEIDWFLSQKEYGACGPIILAESGFVTYPGEPKYSQQMIAYDEYIRAHGYDRWIGFQALFTYGEWGQANIENSSDALEEWLMDNQPTKWVPEFTAVTPPANAPKIVIVKKPQKAQMTLTENEQVSRWAWDNYGRTSTHSTDDMLTMLRAGNSGSYAVVWWADRQPDVIAALNAEGLAFITMPETNPSPAWFTLSIPNMPQFGGGADARSNDCGASCVAMAVNGMTLNRPTVDEVAIRYQNPPNEYMSLTQLDAALNGYGMDGTYKRPLLAPEISDTIKLGKPVICLVWYPSLPHQAISYNGSHFVIAYGTNGERLLYRDPLDVSGQRIEISFVELEKAMRDVVANGNLASQGMICATKQTPPPVVETVDITTYVMGNNLQQFDMDYISGTQTTMIKHDPAGLLYVKGNGQYERLWIADYNGAPWIWRADDTSESHTRMYAHYRSQGGALGAPWFPCHAEVGKWYETGKYVQHFNKADCTPLNGGNVTDKLRLISKPYQRTYSRTHKTLQVVTLEWASGEQYDFSGGNVGFRGGGMDFQFMGWLDGRQPLPIKKYDCFGW